MMECGTRVKSAGYLNGWHGTIASSLSRDCSGLVIMSSNRPKLESVVFDKDPGAFHYVSKNQLVLLNEPKVSGCCVVPDNFIEVVR